MDNKRIANEAYGRLLRQAFWRSLANRLTRSCNDLLPKSILLDQIPLTGWHDLGLQKVPLEHITISGRDQDFDLHFCPRRPDSSGRWQAIYKAIVEGRSLPPVRLLKVGDAFAVLDGNHRISVASSLGDQHIAATVLEIETESLEVNPDCSRLGFVFNKGNQSC